MRSYKYQTVDRDKYGPVSNNCKFFLGYYAIVGTKNVYKTKMIRVNPNRFRGTGC